MKNKLLVFMFLMCLITIQAKSAEMPKVTIGGRLDAMAGSVKESGGYRNTNPSNPSLGNNLRNSAIVNDTKIDINIDGKGPHDLMYGGLIKLNADTSVSTSGENTVGNKTMVYLQHNKIGRIEAGATWGAGAVFEMDIPNFNKGTWGVDGFWSQWVADRSQRVSAIYNATYSGNPLNLLTLNKNNVTQTRSVEFIVSPNLPSNYSGKFYSNAPKVNLFTKPIKELTVGVAVIPDLDSHGSVTGIAAKNGGPETIPGDPRQDYPATFRNIVSGGLMFEKIFSKIGVKAGIVGEVGKAKLQGIRDLKAYEADLMVSYKEFKLGGSYGSWGKTLMSKSPVPNAKQGTQYWTVGFGQQIDKLGYSLTYMQSRKAGGAEIFGQLVNNTLSTIPGFSAIPTSEFSDFSYNKFKNIVLDIDYRLAPGFLPYVGVSMFKFTESKGARDKGYVAMIGTRLLF